MNKKTSMCTRTREAEKETFISKKQKQNSDFSQPRSGYEAFDRTLYLERNLGNEAVQRMMEPGCPECMEEVKAGIDLLEGGGQPLPESTRAFFEPRFEYDFSRVRLHTDANAARTARAINALAFTVGRNVVFADGRYAPGSTSSRRLLAHELAHVVQNRNSEPGPTIKRYEGYEHIDIGGKYLDELLVFLQTAAGEQWANKIGMNRDQLVSQVRDDPYRGKPMRLPDKIDLGSGQIEMRELTPGQIIALMGDHYGSLQALINAPTSEIKEILKVMEKERSRTITPVEARKEYESISRGRFMKLASRGEEHFFRKNKQVWRRMHEEAIKKAREAGKNNNETQFREALLINAAAGHFMTDAFASGHLFDIKVVSAAVDQHLMNHPPQATNPALQSYLGLISFSGNIPKMVINIIHDRMNKEGFLVENGRGMRWRTYGDRKLSQAPETQRAATLAVFLSRQQIIQAKSGADPNPEDVEKLMPNNDTVQRATQKAKTYIPQAVREVENVIYQNRKLLPTILGPISGTIIKANISAVGHPGREAEISRMLESARSRGDPLGVVVPSFSLAEF